jgi:predicted small lipoprotein YifL
VTARARFAILAAFVAAAAGCGQQGPLTLPNDARPIERPAGEPQQTDEERQDER